MKILLFAPLMGKYYEDLIRSFEKYGNHVTFYPDALNRNNDFEEILNQIDKKRASRKFDKYIDNILSSNLGINYDKIILIFGGTCFRLKHIEKLRNAFSNAEFIYYNWDSIKNYPSILEFYKDFDKYYSFDLQDCKEYGFEFLPLFYCNRYLNIEPQYDYLYIMTYSRKKYKNYLKIKNSLPDNIKGYEYFLFPNKLKYYISKILKMDYVSNINSKSVYFKPLDRNRAYELFALSKVIIDSPLANQNGLTIRTFEALHQNRKLITTNYNVKNYEFYCADNIKYIDDSSKCKVSKSFFDDSFNDFYALSEKYSIDSFICTLLGVNNK